MNLSSIGLSEPKWQLQSRLKSHSSDVRLDAFCASNSGVSSSFLRNRPRMRGKIHTLLLWREHFLRTQMRAEVERCCKSNPLNPLLLRVDAWKSLEAEGRETLSFIIGREEHRTAGTNLIGDGEYRGSSIRMRLRRLRRGLRPKSPPVLFDWLTTAELHRQ